MTQYTWIAFWIDYNAFDSDHVMELVLGERQVINTLSYLLLIIMAYFGPNAELFGNIKLEIWQFQQPILDIDAYVLRVSLLMLVDLFSLLINGSLIWKICQVNIFKVFKKLQKSFWYLFAIAEAYVIIEVRKSIPVSFQRIQK